VVWRHNKVFATEGAEDTERVNSSQQFRKSGMTDKITERIIAAAIEVHRTLAPGLPESINATALCHQFDLQSIRYETQKSVELISRT